MSRLLELWRASAASESDAPFFYVKSPDAERAASLLLGSVFKRLGRVTNALRSDCSIVPGDTVAIFAEATLPTALAVHASILAGADVVVLSPTASEQTLLQHLTNTRASVVFFPMGLSARVGSLFSALPRVRRWVLCGGSRGGGAQKPLMKFDDLLSSGEENIAFEQGTGKITMMTSGNRLGERGVELTEDAILGAATELVNSYASCADPRSIVWNLLPPSRLVSFLSHFFVPLLGRYPALFLPPPSGNELALAVKAAGAKIVVADETYVESLGGFETGFSRDTSVVIYPSRRVLPQKIVSARDHIRVLVGYQLTEGGGFVTRPSESGGLDTEACFDSQPLTSSGVCIDTVDVRIVDALGDELPEGETGEIVIRSPYVMVGYGGTPPGDAYFGQHDTLHSGDEGFIRTDFDGRRHLFVTSRRTEMVSRGTEQVNLAIVTALLSEIPGGVISGRAVAFRNTHAGYEIGAVVLVKNSCRLTAENIRDRIHERLSWGWTPKVIVLFRESDEIELGSYSELEELFSRHRSTDFLAEPS